MSNDNRQTEELAARIEAARRNNEPAIETRETAVNRQAMSTGLRAGSELVINTLVGGGLGYMLDQWLHTKPWFMIVFLLFGMMAGFRNIWRLTNPAPPEKETA
jgi:ATP synthase protein I